MRRFDYFFKQLVTAEEMNVDFSSNDRETIVGNIGNLLGCIDAVAVTLYEERSHLFVVVDRPLVIPACELIASVERRVQRSLPAGLVISIEVWL